MLQATWDALEVLLGLGRAVDISVAAGVQTVRIEMR